MNTKNTVAVSTKINFVNFHRFTFQKFMKFLIVGIGILIPIIFGYWRYTTTSETNALRDAVGWGILSIPFSTGLWLSTMQIGRKLKLLTLLVIALGASVHIMFSVYPFFFLLVVVPVEIYAGYSLFKKVPDEITPCSKE